ncbi:MAG TPA: type II secretion system protein [Thermoanaerobaculia bacterium]|jgi:type II secretory pathway pseudopilin PulG|nr:type II secretion system protein [Thermoanaerobaculia bacterium]
MQYCAWCGNAIEAVSYAPCPRCGNPSNGAPRPAGGAKGTNTTSLVVLFAIGLLVVFGIIGFLAVIASPDFITARQRAKQKRTMAGIRTLGAALEAYASDNNQEYPKGAGEADLRAVLKPTSIVPSVDAWGHGFQYTCLKDATSQSDKCVGYVIGSAGRDGRFEHDSLLETLAGQTPKATTNFDCDIVYSAGQFVEYPEGVQH